ncbi:DUF4391 domain-containing protein [Schaalia hyovaginalis]|uniref:DUF4391 domain-containing protein n=1 Tax=Schaalia hyovaginalis TaxID=29316 RepID=UPI0026F369E6|nr:DUF4391 domain-containing protein [Schaalia hyovaginalis]MDD7554369.1 DUF4391 domain-containing protein [Schaalia hyovaginalis]MDY3093555.1 DUF4391 domain-containing protein [Schaalia hyovaginalis]MDY5473038.1 DUF4391 domain-containing protein [Collinsella sp.]
MSVRWNDIFQLPERALAGGRRVPKTVLTKQAGLTRLEQRSLDRVARIEHWATVQKSTARVLPHVDEAYDIQSIVFLRIELSRGAAFAEVSRLLHKCFPNPTVVLAEGGNDVSVSVAITRRSLAEQGATVVERVDGTGAFDPGDRAWEGFLDALAFDALPQDDLLAYLVAMGRAVRLSRAIPVLGRYPACDPSRADELAALIAEHDRLASEARGIDDRRRDRELSLNETAKLRMQLKAVEKNRDEVANKIRSICNG